MRTLCISHIKDVDGLASAALALAVKGGRFKLTDYDELFAELDAVPEVEELILCDLGTDASRFEEFSERLEALSRRCRVTYFDHHFLTPEAKERLQNLPIKLVHDTEECTGTLVFKTFKGELPQEARFLALYAAVTDYMDASLIAKPMMERFDRQFILLESTMLSFALAKHGRDYSFLERLVVELSRMKFPHAIEGVPESAVVQARTVAEIAEEVGRKGTKLAKLAYMQTTESSTGNVAKLLLGAFDVAVGVSFKEKSSTGRVEVSLRSTSECKVHLGQKIGEIASRHGGTGGGHKMAAGCSLPKDQILGVLRELDSSL